MQSIIKNIWWSVVHEHILKNCIHRQYLNVEKGSINLVQTCQIQELTAEGGMVPKGYWGEAGMSSTTLNLHKCLESSCKHMQRRQRWCQCSQRAWLLQAVLSRASWLRSALLWHLRATSIEEAEFALKTSKCSHGLKLSQVKGAKKIKSIPSYPIPIITSRTDPSDIKEAK